MAIRPRVSFTAKAGEVHEAIVALDDRKRRSNRTRHHPLGWFGFTSEYGVDGPCMTVLPL
jgi:hypothetical protein